MESTIAVLLGLFMGGLGGFLLSILTWLEGTEPFNTRKNVASVIVSVLTGVGTTIALVQTSIFTDPTTPNWELLIAFVTILGSAAGFGSMARKGIGAANAKAGKVVSGQ
jgi:hypothetical protein